MRSVSAPIDPPDWEPEVPENLRDEWIEKYLNEPESLADLAYEYYPLALEITRRALGRGKGDSIYEAIRKHCMERIDREVTKDQKARAEP